MSVERNPVVATSVPVRSKATGEVIGYRNAPVDFTIFSRAYKGARSVEDVIANVAKETGVTMTIQNVRMKAAGLRKSGVNVPNLPSVTSGKRGRERSAADIAALNEMFAAESAESAEKEVAE